MLLWVQQIWWVNPSSGQATKSIESQSRWEGGNLEGAGSRVGCWVGVRLYHGCWWETFYIFAYCGLVGNPHLTAICFLLPTSTKI